MFNNEFSKEIYEQTYRFKEETIDDTIDRISDDLSSIENDKDYWKTKFKNLLTDFKFVPGGRIISNAGLNLKSTSYINCFVHGFEGSHQDSMLGILDALKNQALILKSEGGYGMCADVMRPRGGYIDGIANESPGSVKMLDMWDTQSAVITAGSGNKSTKGKQKIRKGAQMVTMSVWHPDIEEFITAKQSPDRLTKFNMSVLVSDDFMDAVQNHKEWCLEFPDFESCKDLYDQEWKGNLKNWKEQNYPTKIYKTYNDANILYDLIMKSTYNRNEPGILFYDTINRLNNLNYIEHISATNPCGEQLLPVNGSCLLGSINLTQYINFETKTWDYDKLEHDIPIAVRLMDNVIERTVLPLESQKLELLNKRRIGLGIMGYGSALMMLNIRYGSDIALKLTEDLMIFFSNKAYQSSTLLAKEKGGFKLYNENYLNSQFVKNLSDETKDMIKQNGIRNSHLLSIQPTGNTGILANVVSGGLEPVFMPIYKRTSTFPYNPEFLDIPKNIDWIQKTYTSTQNWVFINEGDSILLKYETNGYVWKYESNRGLLRETIVKDYAVQFLEEKGLWDENADYAATTTELSVKEHVDTMKILSKYIDSAMSKTINLKSETTYDEFKDVYLDCFLSGTIKGCTTYRAGTMTEVLGTIKAQETKIGLHKTTAPKRPEYLKCDIHYATIKGEKWIVIIGLWENNEPYEIFVFKQKNVIISNKISSGRLRRVKSGYYNLEVNGFIFENLTELFETTEEENISRMISSSLRHGMDIHYIVNILNKTKGEITSFSKVIARTLKKYVCDGKCSNDKCDMCGEKLVYQEGCLLCPSCGYSKCG